MTTNAILCPADSRQTASNNEERWIEQQVLESKSSYEQSPLHMLAEHLILSKWLSPLTSSSSVYLPFSSLTVPFLHALCAKQSRDQWPRKLVVTSWDQAEVDALWETISDRQLSQTGWETVETRLLSEGETGPQVGQGFSHVFVHVVTDEAKTTEMLDALRGTLKDGGCLVCTSWGLTWRQTITESAESIQPRIVGRTALPIRNDSLAELRARMGPQGQNLELTDWSWEGVLGDWNVDEVSSWTQQEQKSATDGWVLEEKARFDQALRKRLVRAMNRPGNSSLNLFTAAASRSAVDDA